MALTRAEQEELVRRADRLSSLLHTPGWAEITTVAQEKIASLRRTAMNLALLEAGADQRKLDTIRGTIAALNWFAGVPGNASTTFQRFMAEQGIEVEEGDE